MNKIAHLPTSRIHPTVLDSSVSMFSSILRYQPYIERWEEVVPWQHKLTLWKKKKYPYPLVMRTFHARDCPLIESTLEFYTRVRRVELRLYSYRPPVEMTRLDTLRILFMYKANFSDLLCLPPGLEELEIEIPPEEVDTRSHPTPEHPAWIHLTHTLSQLRVLRIKHFYRIWDDSWWKSIMRLTRLVELHIDNVVEFTSPSSPLSLSSSFAPASSSFCLPNIRALTLSFSMSVQSEDWREISRWTPHVKDLTCKNLYDWTLADLSQWTQLQKLHLYLDVYFEFDLHTLLERYPSSLRHLKVMCLRFSSIRRDSILSLSLFIAHLGTSLTHLEVEAAFFDRNEWTLMGRGLGRLLSLSVTKCHLSHEMFSFIMGYFPLLERFHHDENSDWYDHNTLDATIITTGWPHLTYLYRSVFDVDDLSLQNIVCNLRRTSHSLHTLCTPNVGRLTATCVVEIAKLLAPALRHWYLSPIRPFTVDQLDIIRATGCTLHFDPESEMEQIVSTSQLLLASI